VTFFRAFAYLSPLLAGFGVAAALAWTAGKPAKRRAAAAGAVFGGLSFLLLVAGLVSGGFGQALVVVLFLAAFCLLVAAVFLFGEALALPSGASQVLASLVVCGLAAAPFLLGPVLQQAERSGMDSAGIARRIEWALSVCPWTALDYGLFHDDSFHNSPTLYATRAEDFQHGRPTWGATALGYALAAALIGAAAFGLRALRRKVAPAP
jgi:hypothetical protein